MPNRTAARQSVFAIAANNEGGRIRAPQDRFRGAWLRRGFGAGGFVVDGLRFHAKAPQTVGSPQRLQCESQPTMAGGIVAAGCGLQGQIEAFRRRHGVILGG